MHQANFDPKGYELSKSLPKVVDSFSMLSQKHQLNKHLIRKISVSLKRSGRVSLSPNAAGAAGSGSLSPGHRPATGAVVADPFLSYITKLKGTSELAVKADFLAKTTECTDLARCKDEVEKAFEVTIKPRSKSRADGKYTMR